MKASRKEGSQGVSGPLLNSRPVVGRTLLQRCAVFVACAVVFAPLGCVGVDGRSTTVESHGAAAADTGGVAGEQDDARDRSSASISATRTTTVSTTTTVVQRSTSLANAADTALAAATTNSDSPGGVAPGTLPAEGPFEAPAVVSPPPPQSAGPQDAGLAAAVSRLSSDHARRVATAALGLVRYDWASRLPGWTLHFADGRVGHRGLTFVERRAIEVYVRPSDTPEMVAHIVAHEIGHAVDLTYLNDTGRAAWLAARGLPASTVWYPGMSGESDFGVGAGDFAESFAWMFATQVIWSGRLASPPTFAEGLAMAVLIGGA